MNKSVTANRLNRLADFLTTVPKEAFKMEHWATGLDDSCRLDKKKAVKCGTAACAFGWATAIPAFRKAGLRLTGNEVYGFNQVVNIHKMNYSVFGTAMDFFGITDKEAHMLFHPDNYNKPTKHNVIKRLRSVAKQYG